MSQERRKRMKEDDDESQGEEFLFGNTEMGVRVRNKDWSTTPLGNPSQWPQSLRTAASMCLHNRFPTLIVWGKELTQIYNDGYSRLLQHRHPLALGAAYKDCWADIWAAVEHLYMGVVNTGEALYLEDSSLWMNNNENIPQERYFTYSFSPIYIEGSKIGGVLNTVTETTERILNNRQLKLLRELGSHTTEATRMDDASRIIANVLTPFFQDVPFAAIYFTDSLGQLVLASTVHIDQGADCCPTLVSSSVEYSSFKERNLVSALLRVAQSDSAEYFDLQGYEVPKVHPGIPENSHVRGCMLMPIEMTHGTTAGVMLVAVSPNRAFDETYRGFFKLLAGQTAALIGNAKSHEEERRKAEILAELDRAKTLFFSNISHEFRTPITLMLGPIEDLITKERSYAEAHEMLDQLELIHRNALRLLKLVNTLLDFSRIEAGRMEASFYPVNLSRLTEDLASVFRSAAERVGLEFIVDCEDLSEPVYIDNDMYEKIVLNLISNAYKFTLRGHIAVRIKQLGQQAVQLSVEDTGTGIPDEELPKIFDRFHRVPESKGRTHEGTGIGLAMVSELVKLHGGNIQAYSKVGKGTLFVVTLNFGHKHLPQERVHLETRVDAEHQDKRRPSYVRTEEWWLGSDSNNFEKEKQNADPMNVEKTKTDKPCVLIVDDNADMREYIFKLLDNDYDVHVACDGLHALELVSRQTPELILSDIMMPKLDGFGLLQRLREDPKTKTIPVIFLSARAGEEARVEGLKSGADDYLVKPFTARELQARIRTHIDLQRVRRESAERSEQANRAKDHFLAVLSHELRTPLTPALMLAESLESNESLPQNVRHDLEMITQNIKLEVRLIDDLLDVTRISKNKLVLSLKPVDVHKELEHTVQLVKHDAEQKNITFHTSFNATSVSMEADNSRLQQIFWNIVKNAVKFTPRDGHISITTINEEADQITVKVTDSGIGVEPSALPTIFDSFQQGSSAITYQFGGLGLGLSICKALTTMMHGTISAHSEGRGTGSTFIVKFPTIQTAAQSPPRDDLSPSAVNVPPQRILMVEDNKSTALVMTRFLKKLGHDVKTAYSVKEALELAEAFKFDMVISDVGLPDGSGFDLMKSLHSMYGLRGVCVSGYGMEEDVKKSKECGFDFHLVKPVEINVLQTAIGHVVRTKPN